MIFVTCGALAYFKSLSLFSCVPDKDSGEGKSPLLFVLKLIISISFSIGLLLCTGAAAQFTLDHSNYKKGVGFVTDVSGRPADPKAYDRISDGSPWWYDFFIPADLAGQDGRIYRSIPVKVDLLAGKVYYLDGAGATMELMTPVLYLHAVPPGHTDTLKLVRTTFFAGVKFPETGGWLQLHIRGEATLLRQLGKQMQENKGFGSATTEYSIANRYEWLVLLEGSLVRVKKVKELQEMLGKRKPALLKYSGQQKGFDAQVQELVQAYNHM